MNIAWSIESRVMSLRLRKFATIMNKTTEPDPYFEWGYLIGDIRQKE